MLVFFFTEIELPISFSRDGPGTFYELTVFKTVSFCLVSIYFLAAVSYALSAFLKTCTLAIGRVVLLL